MLRAVGIGQNLIPPLDSAEREVFAVSMSTSVESSAHRESGMLFQEDAFTYKDDLLVLSITPVHQTDSKRRHKSKLHELEEEVRMQMSSHKRMERSHHSPCLCPCLHVTCPRSNCIDVYFLPKCTVVIS